MNIGTIAVALVLLVIVAAVILKMRRDKKTNRCAGCPCGCANSGVPLMEKFVKKVNSVV